MKAYHLLVGPLFAGVVLIASCAPTDAGVQLADGDSAHTQCPSCSYCPEGYTQIECEEYWAEGGDGATTTVPPYRDLTEAEYNAVYTAVSDYIFSWVNSGCYLVQDALSTMLASNQIKIQSTTTYTGHWAERIGSNSIYNGIIVIELAGNTIASHDWQSLAQILSHELFHPYLGMMYPDPNTLTGGGTVGEWVDSNADECVYPPLLRQPHVKAGAPS